MSSLRPVGRSASTLDVGRSAATLDRDGVSACRFTSPAAASTVLPAPLMIAHLPLANRYSAKQIKRRRMRALRDSSG